MIKKASGKRRGELGRDGPSRYLRWINTTKTVSTAFLHPQPSDADGGNWCIIHISTSSVYKPRSQTERAQINSAIQTRRFVGNGNIVPRLYTDIFKNKITTKAGKNIISQRSISTSM